MPKSQLEQLPHIVANGHKQAEAAAESAAWMNRLIYGDNHADHSHADTYFW